MDSISIIGGTGALGFGLALRLAATGTPVVIGSRDEARAKGAAERLAQRLPEATVEGLENAAAAKRSRIVFVCVPFRNQSETYTNLKDALTEEQIVVDCTVPLAAAVSGKATRVLGVWQGSAAQQAQEMVPKGVRVVAALHTVAAPLLADLDHALAEDTLVCGDRKADKRPVAEVLSRIDGLRPVDAGRLEQARIAESMTALMIGVNARYKVHSGLRLENLPADLWPE